MGGVLVEEVLLPSDNNKLKKLGKYFTKGLQAGVLATALIAGTVGCSNAAGGSEISNSGGVTGGNGENGGNGQGNQTGYTKPDYMNVTAEFGGQHFVDTAERWNNDTQYEKNNKLEERYKDAKEFMKLKVTELQNEVNSNSTLYGVIDNALKNYNSQQNIDADITNNYNALAPVFAKWETHISNDTEFAKYRLSYYKLAVDAFNQSTGNISLQSFDTNKEFKADNIFFATELTKASINYADLTTDYATTTMSSTLSKIANATNTNVSTLKKIVELALYNESLHGLHDFAVIEKVNGINNNQRSYSKFYQAINDAEQISLQNIDDRTM